MLISGGEKDKMNTRGQQAAVITFLVAIMVIVILAAVTSDFVITQNTLVPHEENNISATMNQFFSLRVIDIQDGSEVVTNYSSGETLTLNTDYFMDYAGGNINISSDAIFFAGINTTVNITYNQFPTGYLKNATQRTLILIVPILIIVAVLLFVTTKIKTE